MADIASLVASALRLLLCMESFGLWLADAQPFIFVRRQRRVLHEFMSVWLHASH